MTARADEGAVPNDAAEGIRSTQDARPESPAQSGNVDPSKTHQNVIHNAKAAAAKEQSMTLWQGIKLYPKAVAWSVLISTCIAMEGYDISLVNNFC